MCLFILYFMSRFSYSKEKSKCLKQILNSYGTAKSKRNIKSHILQKDKNKIREMYKNSYFWDQPINLITQFTLHVGVKIALNDIPNAMVKCISIKKLKNLSHSCSHSGFIFLKIFNLILNYEKMTQHSRLTVQMSSVNKRGIMKMRSLGVMWC